jgi:hypothetical protein
MVKLDTSRPVPILILGDGPDDTTGLSRISHDLSWLLSSMPEFKVGNMGRLAFGRSKYPWAQYSFGPHEQWGEERLEEAWNDLSQGQPGVILTLWDASRLLWFADPRTEELSRFLNSGKFQRWGYFMQDAAGVQADKLPLEAAHVMDGYDRVILASKWAKDLFDNTMQDSGRADYLPHPINTAVFKPENKEVMRLEFNVQEDEVLVGCVMTNQERKHWPVVMEAVAQIHNAKLWARVNKRLGYWNMDALAVEYGLSNRIILEDEKLSDYGMALRYSACDVTVNISGGEGFGYPVAESLACGVPVMTGEYGAQAELLKWTLEPDYTAESKLVTMSDGRIYEHLQ